MEAVPPPISHPSFATYRRIIVQAVTRQRSPVSWDVLFACGINRTDLAKKIVAYTTHLVPKFDHIWVISKPKKRKGRARPLLRIVVTQCDQNPNRFRLLRYFPDHQEGPTDPYNAFLSNLELRWMNMNIDYYRALLQ